MADAPSVTVDQPQRTLHVFAAREDGAVVIDLWENEDGFHRMRDDPEFRRNVEAAGWPSEPKVEVYEVRAPCNRLEVWHGPQLSGSSRRPASLLHVTADEFTVELARSSSKMYWWRIAVGD
jgi:hypothetical protein